MDLEKYEEKLRLMELALKQGERQYIERLDDIKLLKLEVKRLRRENEILSKGVQNMTMLQQEIVRLEREARIERIKVRALQEALETPKNIHHWRRPALGQRVGKVEGIAELRERINMLHKELLNKTQKLTQCEKTSKISMATKGSSSEEVASKDEINTLKHQNIKKADKIRFLTTELNMRDARAFELKLENEKLISELKQLKNKNHLDNHGAPNHDKSEFSTPHSGYQSRVLGGGFKLT